MNIEKKYFRRCVLVTVEGRVDGPQAEKFESALLGLLEEGHSNIALELSGVSYIVSAALRAMITCRNNGGEIRIANPSPRVSYALKLAGFDKVYTIYDNAISAVGSY